jgi:hypothetical protein
MFDCTLQKLSRGTKFVPLYSFCPVGQFLSSWVKLHIAFSNEFGGLKERFYYCYLLSFYTENFGEM